MSSSAEVKEVFSTFGACDDILHPSPSSEVEYGRPTWGAPLQHYDPLTKEKIVFRAPSLTNRPDMYYTLSKQMMFRVYISRLYCFIGSSGVGKDTLANRIVAAHAPRVAKVVGYTTRERRATEVADVDMHFITKPEFETMHKDGRFKEHAVVHGNMYGMTADALSIESGTDKIAIVTMHALEQLKSSLVVTVLLTVSDPMNTLRARLTSRGDSAESIATRMATASKELVLFEENRALFNHVVLCDDRDDAFNQMVSIMKY